MPRRRSMLCSVSILPEPVLRLTRRRHGLVTRAELLTIIRRLGRSPGSVEDWIGAGFLERVQDGVYRVAGCPRTTTQTALAKVLRAGRGARADGEMTCALFGLEGFDLARTPGGVLVPTGRRVRGVSYPVRATALPRGHVATVDRVPAITPTRGLVELARVERGKRWRVAFDSARRLRLTSPDRLRSCAQELGTHPGARACRTLLATPLVVQAESEGERKDLHWLIDGIEPRAEWQVTDVVPGRRLDVGWPQAMFFLEYDGRDHHVLPTDRDNDGLRELQAADAGVQVLRITAGMLREKPHETRALVVRILRRRLAERERLRTTG